MEELKLNRKEGDSILVLITDDDMEIIIEDVRGCRDSVVLYPKEWHKIVEFVERVKRKDAQIHN